MAHTPAAPERLELAVAFVRLAHVVQRIFGEVSRENALTPQQTQLLCRLVDGPVGMAELGTMLDLEKSSLSGLVDRVERRGLVTRIRNSQDRRAWCVALTDTGARLATTSHQGVIDRLEELIGDLDPDGRSRLTHIITHVIASR